MTLFTVFPLSATSAFTVATISSAVIEPVNSLESSTGSHAIKNKQLNKV